ncbi:MAG TPA: tetratricopeptide repeat-containing protein kinase family protein, partial [Pirellulales bacterium]|nr:tetratricopeptide repeat-containing protein kinase family protein [Pirellulales bacterium]
DLLGTLRYMSPEQALAKRVAIDYRTDIYSLGATLYELSTFEPVFAASDKQELLRQLAFEDPRSLRNVRRDVPGEIETIVLKALEKNPSDRYPSAQELADDLRRYLDEKPIHARRPGIRLRSVKWARRHRAAVVAISAVIVLSAVTGPLVAWREASLHSLAEAHRQTAQEREAETAAVLDFVESKVFAAGRPEGQHGGLGHDVTLLQAVEAALPFVEKSFSTQPLIEARLRMTLGVSFLDLGKADKAEEQFQKARTLCTWHLGPDHPNTLNSMNGLANSYADLGRRAEALALREETLALRKAKLGPDHPDTLGSMSNLANSYAALGRYADAVKLCEQTLPVMKAKIPDHAFTLNCMNILAISYADVGRQTEALKLQEETLALQKANLGPEHPDTLRTMNGLANSYKHLGRYAEALKLDEETLALRKAKFAPGHPATLLNMNNLARSYFEFGRRAEGVNLFEETLALSKVKLGPDHPATLSSMSNLANAYYYLGRYPEALKLREETLALQKSKLGADHPDTLLSMNNLAASYAALGRDPDAVKLYEDALLVLKVKIPDHVSTLYCMSNLGASYAALGRYEDALKLREETVTLMKAKLGADHPKTLISMSNVALSLAALDRAAEALPIVDECLRLAAGKVVDPSLIPGVLAVRMRHFAKCNDAAGCRATVEMWEGLKGDDAGSLYNAACFRAVTAAVIRAGDQSEGAANDAAAEADRAMEWLKQAVAAGFKNVNHMKQDTDLEALRTREDFKQLIAELERSGAGP